MRFLLTGFLSIFLIISGMLFNLDVVSRMGALEVFSQAPSSSLSYLWNRYIRGAQEEFSYFGANPKVLSEFETSLPATILVHSSMSNQGEWISLLRDMEKMGLGPVFTFNFKDGDERKLLMQKIIEVKRLYGHKNVPINLIGHSLGGIVSAEYAYSPESWIEGTYVAKVITIAARLKNIENLEETPYYTYALKTVERIGGLYSRIQRNPGNVELYTIAAENDWLLPTESALVGKDDDHKAVSADVGHVLVVDSPKTSKLIFSYLS